METELINIYIQRLVREIEELTKTKMVDQSKLEFAQKHIEQQAAYIQELQAKLQQYAEFESDEQAERIDP